MNSRPLVYKTSALTPELRRQIRRSRHKQHSNPGESHRNMAIYISFCASLQWHSRLARRTYKSVTTKKCEGREFEPPLEHGFHPLTPNENKTTTQSVVVVARVAKLRVSQRNRAIETKLKSCFCALLNLHILKRVAGKSCCLK